MRSILLSLLAAAFAAEPPANPPAAPPPVDTQPDAAASYQTTKSLAAIEQCLTDSLSKLGDVTAVKFEKSTTLMLKSGSDAPMLIDIAPPSVKVTTRFAYGARPLVKACL
jgi:hypothetical protein